MKLLLVGNGKWGKKYISTLHSISNISLDVATRDSWRSQIESKKYQGCIIATPPDSHIDIAVYALEHDVPVMIEKPIALSANECDRLDRYGHLPILINHIHLFSPYFQYLKTRVDPATIRSIKTRGFGPGPYRDYPSLFDWGPHDMAMILDLIGPKSFDSIDTIRGDNDPDLIGGSLYEISMTFGHIQTNSIVGDGSPTKARFFEVRTKTSTHIYDGLAEDQYQERPYGPLEVKFNQTPLESALQVFVNSIDGKHDYRLGLELTKHVMEILDLVWVMSQ